MGTTRHSGRELQREGSTSDSDIFILRKHGHFSPPPRDPFPARHRWSTDVEDMEVAAWPDALFDGMGSLGMRIRPLGAKRRRDCRLVAIMSSREGPW